MDSLKNKIFLYRVTNKLNGMIYIGVHKCKHSKCDYLGSGKLIKLAVRKHGNSNFSIKILEYFNTLEEAFNREREIVNINFINRNDTYNIVEGGRWGRLSNDVELSRRDKISKSSIGKTISIESKEKIRLTLIGHTLSEETKIKISKKLKNRKLSSSHRKNIGKAVSIRMKSDKSKKQLEKLRLFNIGSKRSEESKQKMKLAWKKRKLVINDHS